MIHKKSLAIVGIGRWGKNLLREFNKIADIRYCYHHGNPENSKWLKENYPSIKAAESYDEILENPEIDAVIIATPIATHYELTKKALLAGKDVFVEKPITNNVKHAQELVKLAAKKRRILFVGHIFSYHPVLTKIKLIASREPIKYAAFVWNKLGTFNEELVYNLLSHDVATALDLFGSSPISIKILENHGVVTDSDIIFAHLNFLNNRSCTIYINRVSNLKNKTVTLTTDKNVYLWENYRFDRLLRLDPVRGRGTLRALAASFGVDLNKNEFKPIFQSTTTPLEVECAEFIKCLTQNKKPLTSGEFGLEVVKILSKI